MLSASGDQNASLFADGDQWKDSLTPSALRDLLPCQLIGGQLVDGHDIAPVLVLASSSDIRIIMTPFEVPPALPDRTGSSPGEDRGRDG